MLLIMLGVIFITDSSFATGVKSGLCAPTAVWIHLEFIFHRPKFDCERGFGICFAATAGIDRSGASSENRVCNVRGQLNERNQLLIEVDEVALTKYEGGSSIPYFKDKTSISILDPYILPEPACRALGATSALTIKPGNYPVSFQNGVYTVVFQL